MKRLAIAVFLLLMAGVRLYADGTRVLSSETRVISAYKLEASDTVPDKTLTMRLLDTGYEEFTNSEIISTPIDARDADYKVFYWVLGGNIYTSQDIDFTFGPMWLNGLESSGKYIPFTLTLSHMSSKVGNSVLAVNKAPTSIPVTFLGFDFEYADKTEYPATFAVTDSQVSKTVSYNMSTYTEIYSGSTRINDYSYDVCSYWNRMGVAVIHLQIDESGVTTTTSQQLPDGMYYSTVTVTIATGT
jgi:hypothetical protein